MKNSPCKATRFRFPFFSKWSKNCVTLHSTINQASTNTNKQQTKTQHQAVNKLKLSTNVCLPKRRRRREKNLVHSCFLRVRLGPLINHCIACVFDLFLKKVPSLKRVNNYPEQSWVPKRTLEMWVSCLVRSGKICLFTCSLFLARRTQLAVNSWLTECVCFVFCLFNLLRSR